jgi:large subunit ribosomal protein L4
MAITLTVKDVSGRDVDSVELPSDIFEAPINVGLMHQAYVRQMANARLGLADTKTRGEINRTKAKWFRQKGTGRSRHGSRNAGIFVGGGKAHGPQPRSYAKNMPKNMRREALRAALSAKAADGEIVLVNQLTLEQPKTREIKAVLSNLVGADNTALVLLSERNDDLELAMRNMSEVQYIRASYLNVRDLLKHDTVVIPLDALEVLKNWLSKPSRSK